MALTIPNALYHQLREHGEATYPHECCGVLVGEFGETGEKSVKAVVPCGNTRIDSLANRYHIDPAELGRVQREAMLAGRDIVGFYHSHPDHPARWSTTDLSEAHWIGCSYVITSVQQGKAAETNSFELTGDNSNRRFVDEVITVE